MPVSIIDPATGAPVREYSTTDPADVDAILAAVTRVQGAWRRTSFGDRGAPLARAAGLLRERAPELAGLMALEMGKPLAQGVAEAEKCAWVCDYYAEGASAFLAPETVSTEAAESFVAFSPLGPVLAIMPWNFPLWQVFRFAAPALMAGNAVVLKHSLNTTGCAFAVESLMREAGFPADLLRVLVLADDDVAPVIEDRRIAAVTLTGSTRAGRAVASIAGRRLKKTVLELGGSDPYLILEDADLETAVTACATSRLLNSGQSCIAAKRFITVPSIRERFEEALVERLRAAITGDPRDPATTVGPLAREDLRANLDRQVRESVGGGARPLLDSGPAEGPGFFYPPAVLTDVGPGMPAYAEELFGPVAAILPAANEADAVRIANDSAYGLGAAVFTADLERGRRIAVEDLDAGACFVNAFVKSDPRLPFGGIKDSGYGRELAPFGIREFVNVKTVWVESGS